jgi:sugar phosphate permease
VVRSRSLIALHSSYRWALVAGGIVGAVTAVIAALSYVDAPRSPSAPQRVRDIAGRMLTIARQPLTVLFTGTCVILSAGQAVFNAFFVVTAVSIVQVTPLTGATIFAISQIFAVGGRIMWGRLSDSVFRGNRAWPLVCIATLLACAAFALPHAGAGNVVLLAIVGAALGLSAAGWNGVFATAMAEIGGAELAGSVLGLGLTFIFAAQALAPSLFGALADHAGLATAWTTFGAIAAVGILAPLAAARLAGRREPAG